MTDKLAKEWKGPRLADIAALAGVGSATVDRVLNRRDGVSAKTRARVFAAVEKLSLDRAAPGQSADIRLFCDSGESFNAAMSQAVETVNATVPGVSMRGHYHRTSRFDPVEFSRNLLDSGSVADGVIVVSREHPAVNRAIRKLEHEGVPVICVTTDLPSSRRSAYVGNDQHAAGSVAGLLIGNALNHSAETQILLVMSEPFRCQQEREMGFRKVLRSDFPHLRIDERVIVDDDPENSFEHIAKYIRSQGAPAAIYNVAGANRGIARALSEAGTADRTFFVGHELTPHSRALLEGRIMDYVISHDFAAELTLACRWLADRQRGLRTPPPPTAILLHTRYNCGF